MKRPWSWLALAFWAGSLVGPLLGWSAAGVLLAAGLVRGAGGLVLAALAAGALSAVGCAAWLERAPEVTPAWSYGTVDEVSLRGRVVELVVSPDFAPGHRVRTTQRQRPRGLAPGARVRVHGPFERPWPRANPGGFDGESYYATRRIHWQTRQPADLVTPAGGLHEALVRARVAARVRLGSAGQPFGEGVLGGLLLGDRKLVPTAARDALEGAGLAHLLAVSGLHIGGLAFATFAAVAWCARRLHAVHPRRWGAAAAIPAAMALVALAQSPTSATRAGLMVGLWVAGLLVARRGDALNLLGAAALVLLAGDPALARSVGFQLSFGAVAALVTLVTARRGPVALLHTAAVACAATAPLTTWHFGTFAPAGVVSNLLLTPFAAVCLVPLGVLGLLFEPLTSLPLAAAAHLAELTVAIAEALSLAAGGLSVVGWHAAPATALPLVWLVAARVPGAGLTRIVVALAASAALLATSSWLRPATPRAEFLSVGQGDAIVLRDGPHAALVDAGPDPEARVLLAFLRHEGIARLDAAVVSHAHPDHYAGLAEVVRRVPIGRVFTNGHRTRARAWLALERALSRHRLRPEPAAAQLVLGRLVLSLSIPDREAASENDASAVVLAAGPGGTVLLTGDLERAGEAALVASGLAPVTVLKAGHHGSRTSSGEALLDVACPDAVVFTAGRQNRFGFPHPVVRRRYAARSIRQWRTDLDGLVVVDLGPTPRIRSIRRPWRSLATRSACPPPTAEPSRRRARRATPASRSARGGEPALAFEIADVRDAGQRGHGEADEVEARYRQHPDADQTQARRPHGMPEQDPELLPKPQLTTGEAGIGHVEGDEERHPDELRERHGDEREPEGEPDDEQHRGSCDPDGQHRRGAADRAHHLLHERRAGGLRAQDHLGA